MGKFLRDPKNISKLKKFDTKEKQDFCFLDHLTVSVYRSVD